MEIKLQKGRVNHIFNGLGFELFKDQTIGTKIIKIKSAGYMKENSLPKEPKIIQDWKSKHEIIKIRNDI